MSHRYELSDAEWGVVEPLLAPPGGRGRPWKDRRRTLNGMFWVLRSGAPWADLPKRYGAKSTVHEHFTHFRDGGVLDAILAALRLKLDAQGRIDDSQWNVDATLVRAGRDAAGAGEKGGPTSRRTTRSGAPEAASGRKFTS